MSDEQAEYLIDVIRARIPIPLPTVPIDATCGGCRWWAPENWCHIEPQLIARNKSDYACRHYQETAK